MAYWLERGVVHPPPWPLVGNSLPLFAFVESPAHFFKRLYDQFPRQEVIGFFQLNRPMLMVRSPRLLEKVIIKDFGHFVDHGLFALNKEKNWIDQGLFNLSGTHWRAVRNKMTPAFTTGKLKMMFDQMVPSADNLVQYVDRAHRSGHQIKDAMGIFSMEIIASCAFGLDVKNWEGQPKFRRMGSKILNVNWARYLAMLVLMTLPELAIKFDVKFTADDVRDYFGGIIQETMDERARSGRVRNDFVQLMLQLKEKGSVEIQTKDLSQEDDYLNISDKMITESFQMDDQLLMAQAFNFLSAGFDATSTTLTYACFELARNPRVQDKLRAQIRSVVDKHGGAFTYQAIKEMPYLEQCLDETLRIHPLVTFLVRMCTKDYTIEGGPSSGLKIDVGTGILVPVLGLHMDPQYYPEPEEFRPERFDPNITSRTPFTYLPFGDGPRMCIGMRFAILQMKLGLARLVHDFRLSLSANTRLPLEAVTANILLLPKHKIWFDVERIAPT
ncbi:hypothetical protein AAG570_005246 [Ranatra chinensis]|uniref:Cytochrome P450 n=1 Tax=Ranatra chinensis TaxID=642074 RepID=A0ABD0YLP0_9HEMI